MITVREATLEDVGRLAPLFDAYRQFYERPGDLELSRRFLSQRIERAESVIYLAEEDGVALGFVQLYPLFSSTSLRPGRLWLLNDLFVTPAARGKGVGRQLMDRARELAEDTEACGLELATARTNVGAQALYESLGYRRDDDFFRYELAL
ncbi:MAG TPA: GNAT family N-acetyltransferase [Gemmatimonadales bacterium]